MGAHRPGGRRGVADPRRPIEVPLRSRVCGRLARGGRKRRRRRRRAGGDRSARVAWLRQSKLPELLHPGVRWVQLPFAGVEPWTERGLINAECTVTSAAGVYSGTAAEHALALMLAGARRLD